MSKIVRLPLSATEIAGGRNSRPPAPSTAAPADEPRRPDPALLIRQAIIQTIGKRSGINAVFASTSNNVHVDDAILRTLSMLADDGCPTSSVVLGWISARQAVQETGEGGAS